MRNINGFYLVFIVCINRLPIESNGINLIQLTLFVSMELRDIPIINLYLQGLEKSDRLSTRFVENY